MTNLAKNDVETTFQIPSIPVTNSRSVIFFPKNPFFDSGIPKDMKTRPTESYNESSFLQPIKIFDEKSRFNVDNV